MTDPTLDPRESRLDDVDAPREDVDAGGGEVAPADTSNPVLVGRPPTLGADVQDSPAQDR